MKHDKTFEAIAKLKDIEEAIEVLEDASAEMLAETGDENYYAEAIAILRQALKTEQKTAVSPGKGTGFNYFRAIEAKLKEKNHG